jgi:hypothetical protein
VGVDAGLSRTFVTRLYDLIIREACRIEGQLIAAASDRSPA